MENIGRLFLVAGIAIAVVGALMVFGIKIPWLGKLPGDIAIKREGFSFYFPITTCILLSLIITVIMRIFRG